MNPESGGYNPNEATKSEQLSPESIIQGLVDRMAACYADERSQVGREVWRLSKAWLTESDPHVKSEIASVLATQINAAILRAQMDIQMDQNAGRDDTVHSEQLETVLNLRQFFG